MNIHELAAKNQRIAERVKKMPQAAVQKILDSIPKVPAAPETPEDMEARNRMDAGRWGHSGKR